MNTKEYEEYVHSRCKDYCNLSYSVIALNGEAGEVAEWFKKYHLRGNPGGKHSPKELALELGDVLFYLTRLAHLGGWSLKDIMEMNKAKLDERVEAGKAVS